MRGLLPSEPLPAPGEADGMMAGHYNEQGAATGPVLPQGTLRRCWGYTEH